MSGATHLVLTEAHVEDDQFYEFAVVAPGSAQEVVAAFVEVPAVSDSRWLVDLHDGDNLIDTKEVTEAVMTRILGGSPRAASDRQHDRLAALGLVPSRETGA